MTQKRKGQPDRTFTATVKVATPLIPDKRNYSALCLASIIVLITIVAYLPTLKNDFLNWDDYDYVTNNLNIRDFNLDFFHWALLDTTLASYWHPLTWLSHALDYAIWGLNPLEHHLTSVILHSVISGIVTLLIIRLFEANDNNCSAPNNGIISSWNSILFTAGITGILFGLHPIHVESVAWISQRKDLLYSLFYLLSTVIYIRYACDSCIKESPLLFYKNRRYYVSLLLFILALSSKPMAITLPIVLLLLDWYPLKRAHSWKAISALVVEKLPYILFSVCVSLITIISQKAGGALISLNELSFGERTLIAFKGLMMYLSKIIIPIKLLPFYPYYNDASLANAQYSAAILIVLFVSIGCVVVAKKQQVWLAVWAFFIISVFPVLGFIQAGMQVMADRYIYLASMGPFLLVGITLSTLLTKFGTVMKSITAGLTLLLMITLSYLTIQQIAVWKTSVDIWNYVIDKSPQKHHFAYKSRGTAFQYTGMLDRAVEDYTTALKLKPDSVEAYVNRGSTYFAQSRFDDAIEDFNRALAIKPDEYFAFNNRGSVYFRKGLIDKAMNDFNAAIKIHPGKELAYNNRGTIYKSQGNLDLAIADFNKAITIFPNYIDAHHNRSLIYKKKGELDRAINDLNIVIYYFPNFLQAYIDRAEIYSAKNDLLLAAKDYQTACNRGNKFACSQSLSATPR